MSLMNVGVSALNSNQAALQTIGHNIANVNTAGYSRQTVSMKTVPGQNSGSGYIGSGVAISGIARNYSDLLNRQSNAASATSSADAARFAALSQMQDIFSGGDSSLGSAINSMMNAFADVESAPSDGTARNVVLTRITELTARFRSASASMEEQDYLTKQQITNNVVQVNSLAGQIATLNAQISRAQAVGQAANDLLDARDEAIREVNKLVQTTQVASDDGSISLFIGGSQPLVLGSTTGKLSVAETTEYPGSGKLSLYFSQPSGQKVELSAAMVGGGEVAGLLKFNNDDLTTARNLMGRLALSIGSVMNEQNQKGLTLSGVQGGKLFAMQMPNGYSNANGYRELPDTDKAKVEVSDATKLVASDYKVVFGATHPDDTRLVRISDGMTRKIDGTGTYADGDTVEWDAATNSFVADGLRFSLPQSSTFAPLPNQSVLFQPYGSAASTIQSAVHKPDDLAVSNAVSAAIPTSNQGTLQLSNVVTTDFATVPAANVPIQLRFLDTGEIEVSESDGAGGWTPLGTLTDPVTGDPVLYQSGKTIKLDSLGIGLEIKLTGTPGVDGNDAVVISNALDLGNGYKLNAGNASAFLGLRDAQIFDGGTTLSDGFSSAMAVIGTRTQSAKYAAQLSSTVASSLESDRTAVSGVNLDEEAARLLQYQQAYQASAKIIQIAQSLFDSVLNAVN